MRLILLGAPGSGKGTQAKLLSARFRLEHVGTGDLLREAIRLKTPQGRQAEPYVSTGRLVPDSLVNDMVHDRFRRDDRPERFVMDGYPRTLPQAASFDGVLRQQFLSLTSVVLVNVPDEAIVLRLAGRRNCPSCGATYHVPNHPPKRGDACDRCNVALFQRDDDREETIRSRLRQYHRNNEGLVRYYLSQGLLHEVDGVGGTEEVFQRISKAVDG